MKRNIFFILLMSVFLLNGCQNTNETLYQIMFDSNGGEMVETMIVSQNDTIILPETYKSNANFKGWFNKANPSLGPISQLNQINQNTELIAKWEINISYYDKDSSLIGIVAYEQGILQDLLIPSEENLDFVGWFDDNGANHQTTFEVTGHINLYSRWMLTIDYESNSTIDVDSTQHVLYQDEELPKPMKEHYTFQGWYQDTGFIQELKSITSLSKHTTLYAKWNLSDDYVRSFMIEAHDDGYVIVGKNDVTATIIIPSTINEIPVVGIKDYAFANKQVITQLIFEENSNIQFIGVESFTNTSIVSLKLPESVTTIKFGAFKGVSTLSDIEFSTNLETLEKEAFALTAWFQQLKNHLFITNDILFFYIGNEQEITIPQHVTTIYDYAFQGNTSIKTIRFEENSKITRFSEHMFYGSRIETIHVPNSLIEIENRAFEHHVYLKSLIFGTNSQLNKIGDHAFEKSGLTNATFPETIQVIGMDAFSQTPWFGEYPSDFIIIGDILVRFKGHITTVTIPSNIRIIGPKAMAFNFVKNVIISNSVERIEKQAFIGTHLDTITFETNSKLLYIGQEAFLNNYVKGDILLPPSVQHIEDGAFSNCVNLKSITFTNEIPPRIGAILLPADVARIKIYVPLPLLETYRNHLFFEKYASIIITK
jgi:uncharacterized repeat protein (TIGR02543 family)